jgi:hypothetical protein
MEESFGTFGNVFSDKEDRFVLNRRIGDFSIGISGPDLASGYSIEVYNGINDGYQGTWDHHAKGLSVIKVHRYYLLLEYLCLTLIIQIN